MIDKRIFLRIVSLDEYSLSNHLDVDSFCYRTTRASRRFCA